MSHSSPDRTDQHRSNPLSWRVRVALLVLLVLAVITVWTTNVLLTDRSTTGATMSLMAWLTACTTMGTKCGNW